MIRIWMLVLVVAVIFLQVLDRAYVRTLTVKKEVFAISSAEGRIFPLKIEEQEIVNNDSILKYAQDSLVKILNFRPGKFAQHMEEENVQSLFVSKKHYDEFYEQMEVWANSEFRVNNISIKEAIVVNPRLLKTPSTLGRSFRLFEVTATAPTYDRAVGDSQLGALSLKINMIYLGPESGMGLYRIKISYL